MIPEEDILLLIPQRPPFVMIDRLLDCDETVTRTVFRVSAENIFVSDGRLLEPGLIENIAQTAAAGAGYLARKKKKPVQKGFIGAIRHLEIGVLPGLADELVTETTIGSQAADISIISGKIWCGGKVIAQCTMTIMLTGEGE